ncbi:hypothetical protein D3C85_1634160 [compost metagenome]
MIIFFALRNSVKLFHPGCICFSFGPLEAQQHILLVKHPKVIIAGINLVRGGVDDFKSFEITHLCGKGIQY